MIKEFFKNNRKTIFAVLFFLGISVVYFSPVLNGYSIKQADIQGYNGMAKELRDYDELNEGQAIWTNSMFGGMPGYLIHFNKVSPTYSIYSTIGGFLKYPISTLFFAFISFFILARTLKIRFLIAILGAVAYGLTSYHFLIIEAGHVTKMMAIAFFPGVLAGMILTYRSESKKLLLSFGVLALFFSLEIMVNHIQMTYYFIFILIAFGISEFVRHLKLGKLKQFFIRTLIIIFAGLIGLSSNFTNYYFMYNYTAESTRGPSAITVTPDDNKEVKVEKTAEQIEYDKTNSSKGLKRDYIVYWSYGVGETYNFLVPNAKGSNPLRDKMFQEFATKDRRLYEVTVKKYQEAGGKGFSGYWGDQPGTSGPNYVGAILIFLALLYLIFINTPLKWALLGVSILAILLGWGINLGGSVKDMWLTNFFIDYIPLYSKFRAVSTVLVVINVTIPLMAILFLNNLLTRKQEFEDNFKKLAIVGGSIIGVVLIIGVFPQAFFDFINVNENNMLAQMAVSNTAESSLGIQLRNELVAYRTGVFTSDSFRTVGFMAVSFSLLLLFLKGKINKNIVSYGMILLVMTDLISHNLTYLNNEKVPNSLTEYKYWEKRDGTENLPISNEGDRTIFQLESQQNPEIMQTYNNRIQDKQANQKKRLTKVELESIQYSTLNFATNYRVMELDNPFNSSRSSYFHKSTGGYSPAKLRRYQDIIDFYISKEMGLINKGAWSEMKVLNMLNNKYYLYQGKLIYQNPFALGNAWFVNDIKWVTSNNEEILAIKEVEVKNTAIIHSEFKSNVPELTEIDSNASIVLDMYQPNHLVYTSNSTKEGLAVFSEVYYKDGWNAFIDGKKVPHVRANYIVRALPIPAGKHTVEFKFEAKNVGLANTISVVCFLMIAGAIVFGLYTNRKKQLNEGPGK